MIVIARFFFRLVVGLLALTLLVYIADWAVWSVRMRTGNGTDQVIVSHVSVTPLKGQKEIYDFEGKGPVTCTRSLMPPPAAVGWGTPCWWLRRNHTVTTYY